jgi:hypothetical protein
MPLTSKVVNDTVTIKSGGAVQAQGTVTAVIDTRYYVVGNQYFEQTSGEGVGCQENGLTIEDAVQADTDRITDLTTIVSNIRRMPWNDLSDADLSTVATIVAAHT